jgi:hypothetical protein
MPVRVAKPALATLLYRGVSPGVVGALLRKRPSLSVPTSRCSAAPIAEDAGRFHRSAPTTFGSIDRYTISFRICVTHPTRKCNNKLRVGCADVAHNKSRTALQGKC